MKKFIFAAVILLGFCSCEKIEPQEFEWTASSLETINRITGTYTMLSARFSTPVDLSNSGFVSKNLMAQMEVNGWMGTQTIAFENEEPKVVFEQNQVLTPNTFDGDNETQVNLYVPYPHLWELETESERTEAGTCSVDMDDYQFHYKVDRFGELHLFYPKERKMWGGEGAQMLEDISIHFAEDMIFFNARTSYYDWSTSRWKDGRLEVIFRHNSDQS